MPNAIPMQVYIKDEQPIIEYSIDEKKDRNYIRTIVENCLGKNYASFNYKNGQKIETGKFTADDGSITYVIIANITFMGGTEGQHPKDLKRIQYNLLWRDFYDEFSKKGRVLWMGLYSYKDYNVWGFFEPESYLKKHDGKKMISKGGHKAQYSCHIFLNDLYMSYDNEWFSKIDRKGNVVGSVRLDCLHKFMNNKYSTLNPILEVVNRINKTKIKWKEWIMASEAIPFMRELKSKNGFNQWKQNMWNGWLTEAIYSDYLCDNPSEYIDYVATSKNNTIKKEYKEFGLDLAFPKYPYHFVGDLKAVCFGDGNTLLNDESKVKNALKVYKKIWFIMYIHDKKQGKENDYEMVKWRNHYILDNGEWKKPIFDEFDAPKTPHSISYSEMIIIELNEITKNKYFTIGEQYGLNSDGKKRNEKFKVNKTLLQRINDDSFVIYRYRP